MFNGLLCMCVSMCLCTDEKQKWDPARVVVWVIEGRGVEGGGQKDEGAARRRGQKTIRRLAKEKLFSCLQPPSDTPWRLDGVCASVKSFK